ncbi:hypothetical protein GGX14DRAFT_404677 [Mycena pura]|uniref:Uncharacterized protein n=1 Tax=Mycena pura TaxID=153505 RepID=A0AAD6UTV6_9AGAR|nr:hypothetical protein GGX14DRAFT_404677 [Mycena pura]
MAGQNTNLWHLKQLLRNPTYTLTTTKVIEIYNAHFEFEDDAGTSRVLSFDNNIQVFSTVLGPSSEENNKRNSTKPNKWVSWNKSYFVNFVMLSHIKVPDLVESGTLSRAVSFADAFADALQHTLRTFGNVLVDLWPTEAVKSRAVVIDMHRNNVCLWGDHGFILQKTFNRPVVNSPIDKRDLSNTVPVSGGRDRRRATVQAAGDTGGKRRDRQPRMCGDRGLVMAAERRDVASHNKRYFVLVFGVLAPEIKSIT